MKLLRCHILGFGRLIDRHLEFREGLNLVFAPNEAGKTTLQRFLTALLYGQLRPDVKSQRRLDPWVEQFKPWMGSKYGGALWFRLDSGKELEIHRTFGRDDSRIEIRASTGEEITDSYAQQRNGDVLFGLAHLGMTKEIFESVAVIRENRVTELQGEESLRDRIANLAQSGDEDLSVTSSLAKLEEALDSIGSERAPTRPYKQALDRLESLRDEMRSLQERRTEFKDWVVERSRLAGEVKRLEEASVRARRRVIASRCAETAETVRALEQMSAELNQIRTEIDSLGGDRELPAHYLDELIQLDGSREAGEKRLAEVGREKRAATSRLAEAESGLEALQGYGELSRTLDPEKVTEWFVTYLSLYRQKEAAQQQLGELQKEAEALRAGLQGLGPIVRDERIDWLHKAREAAEAERDASRRSLALGEQIARQRSSIERLQSRVRRQWLLVVVLLAGAGAAAGLVPGVSLPVSPLLARVAAAVLALAAAGLLAAGWRDRSAAARERQEVRVLEQEQAGVLERARSVSAEISGVMQSGQYGSLDEFLDAARQAEQLRGRLEVLSPRVEASAKKRDEIERESGQVYDQLRDGLSAAGLSCSPGNLKEQVDVLRQNLRRYRELAANAAAFRDRVTALGNEEESLQQEAEACRLRIEAILQEAGAASVEEFRSASRTSLRVAELRERQASRSREFQRLCGDRTVEGWRERLQELEKQRIEAGAEMAEPGEAAASATGVPMLPYVARTEAVEDEQRRVERQLSETREEYARIVERVQQAFHNYRSLSEVEEDIAEVEETVRDLEQNRGAVQLALDTLKTLSREQQEVLAPQLNKAVEGRFLRLCDGRYEEVKIDPEFNVRVREAGTGALRAAEHLSRGTQDQLYFALRFGVLDLLSNSDELSPCLLDEPFAAYDRERLALAFEILEQEARRRQLIIFTCREDIRDLAGKHQAHIVSLDV